MVRGTVGVCGGQWGCAEDSGGVRRMVRGVWRMGRGVRRMVRVCGGW